MHQLCSITFIGCQGPKVSRVKILWSQNEGVKVSFGISISALRSQKMHLDIFDKVVDIVKVVEIIDTVNLVNIIDIVKTLILLKQLTLLALLTC